MDKRDVLRMKRRDLLKFGGAILIGGAAGLRPRLAFGQNHAECVPEPFEACSGGSPIEVFPTSPLIGGYVDRNGIVRGEAFTELLEPIDPLAPVSALSPAPSKFAQSRVGGGFTGAHQFFTGDTLPDGTRVSAPVLYHIKLRIGEHSFTNLKALPIGPDGRPVVPPKPQAQDMTPRCLPKSTIWGFNGKFPGPMIRAAYGQQVLVRFENQLDDETEFVDTTDFGDPHRGFLVHLHNAHTAPESDGNPNYSPCGYHPHDWVDNMYLNWPAGGDSREMQSFLWFHDHKELHTGANVYKGLVGLYPIYDPILDPGDERMGLRLPGVPVPNKVPGAPDRIEYDVPLVLYDCALDDGITPHKDFHNGCGEPRADKWGQTYFRHFPNHGFVGDVFTVNGVAYPVLEVKRRKYRLRFLDASIARVYRLMLMSSSSSPVAVPGRQGQYQLPDAQQSMRFTQIGSEGGLLPFPIDRDFFDLSPAKRREVIVDFSRYLDGSQTTKGDCVYLVNVLQMEDGRKQDDGTAFDPTYVVPILKIVIGDPAQDDSRIPYKLRDLPPMLATDRLDEFVLERGGSAGGENEWLINGKVFSASEPMKFVRKGRPEKWTIKSGGGWTHPMHFHQEEHRILSRDGNDTVAPPKPTIDSNGIVRPTLVNGLHVDDWAKEDTIAIDAGPVVIYRNFRSFEGPYVAHCHNLAHEDHNMMFGWNIMP